MKLEVYRDEHREAWNSFVADSKNGTFLFDRDYMEYHADRFSDHSILFFNGGNLVAVMPANVDGKTLVSHGGLTYGGIVTSTRMETTLMLEIMDALREHLMSIGITKLVYKAVPHIYHSVPAEEDLYALFLHNAKVIKTEVSSTIDMREPVRPRKERRYGVRKGEKEDLEICQTEEWEKFMALEEDLLQSKYGVSPVHTAEEMRLLAGRFPHNVRLFAAFNGKEMVAGTVLYESKNVVHTQYIAASDRGKELSAVDALLEYVIRGYMAADSPYGSVLMFPRAVSDIGPMKRYFDFGISTEDGGRYLNRGLIWNKESWGARATVYVTYELDVGGMRPVENSPTPIEIAEEFPFPGED